MDSSFDCHYRINRRELIKSVLFSACAGLLASVSRAQASASGQLSTCKKRVYIFQDRAHFCFDVSVEEYKAPTAMASTRRYVDRLSEEEFLKRHWFV